MTTQLEQAARQALEALEKSYKINGYPENKKAITALRAALEQPAQDDVEQSSTQSKETFDQPVAYKVTGKFGDICSFRGGTNIKKGDLIYTRLQAREQQPCPYVVSTREGTHHCSLSQREWVGLTDEEIDLGLLRSDYALQSAHAWRAGVVFTMTQLKEKNT